VSDRQRVVSFMAIGVALYAIAWWVVSLIVAAFV
jgi:hypothetical protein